MEKNLEPGLVGPDPHQDPTLLHYAFSRGYRAGLENKRLTDMPSGVRRSSQLRSQFENGWQTAKDELQAGLEYNRIGTLRQKLTWIIITALAGLATAYLMIGLVNLERGLFTPPSKSMVISTVKSTTEPTAKSAPAFNFNENSAENSQDLGLFSAEDRKALAAIQAESNIQILPATEPIAHQLQIEMRLVDSLQQTPIEFDASEQNAEQNFIPKNIRRLTAQLQISEPQPLKVRWLWQRQLISEQTFAANRLIHSEIQLAAGWAGEWHLELLDESDQLLYLYRFFYAQPQPQETK